MYFIEKIFFASFAISLRTLIRSESESMLLKKNFCKLIKDQKIKYLI